ncbi:MAG TPA: TonB-dependent receptor [Chitinophagales bacterium]|nr:TonB-dependent receptor [Chitinophagales bacterium]
MKKALPALLCFVFVLFKTGYAQTGDILGTVTDIESKEPIASVAVRCEKQKNTITDAVGKYKISLPAGEYELRFSSIGFKAEKRTVTVVAGETQTLNVQLNSAVFKLNEVVTVSQYKKNAATETVSTAVVTRDQIKNTNSQDVGEAISKTPGVLVQDGQISIRGGSSFSYGVGSRTTLLVDGLDLSSADLGQTQNTLAPLENAKQIEVIKGASSVIYGSSALNGVVNIITDWPTEEKPKTEIETNFGVSDKPKDRRLQWWSSAPPFFGSLNVTHARRIKDLQLLVGGNITYNSSHLQNDNTWRMRGFIKTRYIHPKIAGLTFGANASVMLERADQFFISRDLDSLSLVPSASSSSEYNKITIDPHVTYSNIKGHNYKLMMRYINIWRPGAGDDIDAVSHGLIVNNQYQYRFKEKLLIITAGIPFSMGYSQSNLYQNSGKHFNFNWAAYLQAEVNYKILSLQAGLRYEIAGLDTSMTFGFPAEVKRKDGTYKTLSLPIFRAGLNIQASKSTNIRASWGQGFRIPTIGEKYIAQPFVAGVNIVPNDTLKTERAWNFELGISQGVQVKDWKLGIDLAFFWQEYKNFVEYQVGFWPNAYSNGQPIFNDSLEVIPGQVLGPRALNVDAARVAGYEIAVLSTGKIGPVGINLTAGYTYNFPTRKDNYTGDAHYTTKEYMRDFFVYNGKRVATDDTASRILAYRFRHLFRADVELTYWKAYLGATFYYTSTPERVPEFFKTVALFIFKDVNALEKYLDKHGNGDFAMDIRAGVKVNDRFRMGFIVKNVTNNLYSLRPGRPEPLRTFTFQFRYNF